MYRIINAHVSLCYLSFYNTYIRTRKGTLGTWKDSRVRKFSPQGKYI